MCFVVLFTVEKNVQAAKIGKRVLIFAAFSCAESFDGCAARHLQRSMHITMNMPCVSIIIPCYNMERYSSVNDKYFFDAHFMNIRPKEFEYNVIDYYFEIPGKEVSKSSYIDQQPNR